VAGRAVLALGLTGGRLLGDRLVAGRGRARVVRACGVVTSAGAALAVLAPSSGLSLAGWAVLGAGLSAVAPAVLGAAGQVAPGSPAAAIATVSALGYLGSFTGSPLVGAIAGATSLRVGLLLLVVVAVVLAASAGRALETPAGTPRGGR
jgi:MFS family permease